MVLARTETLPASILQGLVSYVLPIIAIIAVIFIVKEAIANHNGNGTKKKLWGGILFFLAIMAVISIIASFVGFSGPLGALFSNLLERGTSDATNIVNGGGQ